MKKREPPTQTDISEALALLKRAFNEGLHDHNVGGDRAVHYAKVRVANVPALSENAWQIIDTLCGSKTGYVFTQKEHMVTCLRCARDMRRLKTLHGTRWLEFT